MHRKLFGLLVAVLTAALLFGLANALVLHAAAADRVIFICDGAQGTGQSASSPLKPTTGNYDASASSSMRQNDTAIYQAVEKLLESGGGTVVICGPYTLDDSTGQGSGAAKDLMFPLNHYRPGVHITYTSVWDGVDYRETNDAALIFDGYAHYICPSSSLWTDLTVKIEKGGEHTICAGGGNSVVFGEGFTSMPVNPSFAGDVRYYLNVCGGERYRKFTGDSDLTVDVGEGELAAVCGAQSGAGVNYPMIGNTSVVIKSGIFHGDICGACLRKSTPVNGNAAVTIEGGAFLGFVSPGGSGGFLNENARAELTITGGDFSACQGIGEVGPSCENQRPAFSKIDFTGVDDETAITIRGMISRFSEVLGPELPAFSPGEDAPVPPPGKEDGPGPLSAFPSLFAFCLFAVAVAVFATIGIILKKRESDPIKIKKGE